MNLRGASSAVWINVVIKHSLVGDWDLHCYDQLVGTQSVYGGDRSHPIRLRYEISQTVGTRKKAAKALANHAFTLWRGSNPVEPSIIDIIYLDDEGSSLI